MPGVSRTRQYQSSSEDSLLRTVRWDPEVYPKVVDGAAKLGRSVNACLNEVMGAWADALPEETEPTGSLYQDTLARLSGEESP